MTQLPTSVSKTLSRLLDQVSRSALKGHFQTISDAYRAEQSSSLIENRDAALAYSIARMPATYAAVSAALEATIEILPELAPQSCLDVGAGPGTASWAALRAWPSLRRLTLVDHNKSLLAIAQSILDDQDQDGPSCQLCQGDILAGTHKLEQHEVVIASYSLTELPTSSLNGVLAKCWEATGELLIIVEPGTPAGFGRILEARSYLTSLGAHIVAPCSHAGTCPMNEERWCHFNVRLPRTKDHRITKGASLSYEDERYSFLVVSRAPVKTPGFRVLATPKISKPSITLTLCAQEKAQQLVISQRNKSRYKAAKKLRWGDFVTEEMMSEEA